MSKTAFTVPESTVIYSNNANAYISFSEGTSVSGNLLLKAVNTSSVLVIADASKLRGGSQVYGGVTADLYLFHGSEWVLTKNTRRESREIDLTDSSLSSVSLSDSTIVFDEHVSNGYQTLHIGRKIDEAGLGVLRKEVYSAEGNVQIKLSAFLNNDGSFASQKTGRILIYGDVSGTAFVHMQNFLRISDKKVHKGKDQSISIIQVFGVAQEDSLKFVNNYTIINYFPYQYRIRGYGLGSSFGKADSRNRLVAGDGDFWDFRLEGIYIKPEADSSETTAFTPHLLPLNHLLQ